MSGRIGSVIAGAAGLALAGGLGLQPAPAQARKQFAPAPQRVVLYDEGTSDPEGRQYAGSVIWRTEPVKASGNRPADIMVRADIDVPDLKFKMKMSFRRNTDATLPASHTIELTFDLLSDLTSRVANVPGILMKSDEKARPRPLAGIAVKVTDGFFLFGFSNAEADRVRNVKLLRELPWLDVPLVYTNRRNAIIAIEKGEPGERALDDAFAAWGQ